MPPANAARRDCRQRFGVSPTTRRKARVKWAWSLMPQLSAISLNDSVVDNMSCCAISIRRHVR
jgi:hypothetical protein